MLLALDTSTPLVSVALCDPRTDAVLDAATSDRPLQHGEQLAPMVAGALSRAGVDRTDLTALAVGVGPGAYTGLRVGVVTARTLGYALGIPVHGVLSLDVLAAAVDGPHVATVDARRKELFWAEYAADGTRLRGPEVGRPADLAALLPPGTRVVGAGPVLYPDVFPADPGPSAPDAATLARMVGRGTAELVPAEPVYLRRPDATVPGPAKRVT